MGELNTYSNGKFLNENLNNNYLENEKNLEIIDSKSNNLKPTFSKRILCELIKSDVNQKEGEIIYDIGQKLNDLVEIILNKSENKFYFVQTFICYIVEINSELIRLLPEFANLKDDIYIRYIISSKNIYNYAIEVYFSLNDMYNVSLSLIKYLMN